MTQAVACCSGWRCRASSGCISIENCVRVAPFCPHSQEISLCDKFIVFSGLRLSKPSFSQVIIFANTLEPGIYRGKPLTLSGIGYRNQFS